MDALLSILCGSEKQVSGKLYLEGREVSGWEETEARKQGIYRIHPESSLIQHMDVAENLCLILECQIPRLTSEPHMTKVTCFSAALSGKTKYRRIRL